MQRAQRLQAARAFVRAFTGKRLVLGYAKWFGVDRMCAIKELRMLQADVPAREDEAARAALVAAQSRRARRLAQATAAALPLDADATELDEVFWAME
jgi:hypothetical protein